MILIKENVCPAAAFQAGLHSSHRRLTRPRQIVLEVVKDASRHLTPAEIYERAKAKYPRLGLATVYRSLDLLVELGYIQRVHLEQGCHSYALIERQHGHHLVCARCGRIEEFADCDLDPLIRALRTKTGYEISVHMLELMGECPSCQNRGHARAKAKARARTQAAKPTRTRRKGR